MLRGTRRQNRHIGWMACDLRMEKTGRTCSHEWVGELLLEANLLAKILSGYSSLLWAVKKFAIFVFWSIERVFHFCILGGVCFVCSFERCGFCTTYQSGVAAHMAA
jgi:hypothetical protein